MLTLYRLLAILLGPLLIRRLHRPGSDHDGLRERRRERRGHVQAQSNRPIWIHAASVGEVNAATGLIEALQRRWPEPDAIVVSTFTVTGALQLGRRFGDRLTHHFLPVDTLTSTRRWLDRVDPSLCIIIETEIWPELFEQLGRRGVGIVIANARLGVTGQGRAKRFGRLYRRALAHVDLALCQTEQDAERFRELGLAEDKIEVGGNLKFDAALPPGLIEQARTLRQQWGQRPSWVAGSTRPGEESIVLAAHQRLLERYSKGLLVLAPRHPERAAEVAELIRARNMRWQRLGEPVQAETQIVLVDRLGVLGACYAAAQSTFVGGSLVPLGGHNLLEPAALGKAVMTGPYLDQQQAAASALDAAGALVKVDDAASLAAALEAMWTDPNRALEQGRAALAVIESGRGALRRTVEQVLSRHARLSSQRSS